MFVQVEDESVTTFNYVAGITAVLTNQIKEVVMALAT